MACGYLTAPKAEQGEGGWLIIFKVWWWLQTSVTSPRGAGLRDEVLDKQNKIL